MPEQTRRDEMTEDRRTQLRRLLMSTQDILRVAHWHSAESHAYAKQQLRELDQWIERL